MAPVYESELVMLLSGLLSSIPTVLMGIASYVLTALAIYTIARRRGLSKPWLAWVPVVNCWLLGSLSDQYRYVVRNENRTRRKWLVILKVASFALSTAVIIMAFSIVGSVVIGGYRTEAQLISRIMGPAISMMGLSLPLAGISIAYAVIYFIALYDVYKSLDPDNAVLFLVLSVLFRVTEPFFLFFNRDKDKGMPPRKPEPVFEPRQTWQEPVQEPVQEPWEHKDYL